MSQKKSMNDFFNYISGLSILGLNLNENSIYSNLVSYNIKNPEFNKIVRENFAIWIDYFKNISNIEVFNTERWKYFCQFTNNDEIVAKGNPIKIYIPQDKEHILKSAILLFDFLAKNNIKHNSKISSDVRIDDIVVRVSTKEDAEKIRKFVSANDYIKRGLINNNPFTVTDGNISFSYDDKMSYNSFVSKMVNGYMKDMKEKNLLKKVDQASFLAYLKKYYETTFITKENLKNLASTFEEKGYELSIKLNNCREILELLMKKCNPNFGLEDFYEAWEQVNNRHQKVQNIEEIDQFLNKKSASKNDSNLVDTLKSVSLPKKCEILKKAAIATYKKYGYEFTQASFTALCLIQDASGITRKDNARDNILNNIDLKEVKNLIINMVGTFDIKRFLNMVIAEQKHTNYDDLVYNAVSATFIKYGEIHAMGALKKALLGNLESLTNENNARINLSKHLGEINISAIIQKFLRDRGYTNDEIINNEVKLYVEEIKLLNPNKVK